MKRMAMAAYAASATAMLAAAAGAIAAPPEISRIMPADPRTRAAFEQFGLADATVVGDMVYVSGVIVQPPAPGEDGVRRAFDQALHTLGEVLARSGSSWADVVEISSFHTDLKATLTVMAEAKKAVMGNVTPAWTAIGISAVNMPGALGEIKLAARRSQPVPAAAPAAAPTAAVKPAPIADSNFARVVQAERDFAALAAREGITPAFKANIAANALVFKPDPVRDAASTGRDGNSPGKLRWWPVAGAVSAAGDLGFTTGPYVYEGDSGRKGYGHYMTIWRRQADGGYRFEIDHGIQTNEGPEAEDGAPVTQIKVGKSVKAPAAKILAEVKSVDDALNAALARDGRAPFLAAIRDDGRMMRNATLPAQGRAAVTELVKALPETLKASYLGGDQSAAGDLAYTYGDADWIGPKGPRRGHYIRFWTKADGRWRLVMDEVVPAPPRPEAKPAG